MGMFDPEKALAKKQGAGLKRKALEAIKAWVRELLPAEILQDVDAIAVQEFQCGDPSCSPVDTAVRIMMKHGGSPLQSAMSKPMVDVVREDVEQCVERMVDPGSDSAPLSTQGEAAFDRLTNEFFTSLGALRFEDQMGICQRMFNAIEDFERLAVQREMMRRRQQSMPNPQSMAMLTNAQQNNAEELQRIISSGVDPSSSNAVGQTALHVACLWGNTAATECLIRNGADVNRQNNLTSATPLHIAVASPKDIAGRIECVKLLLAANADLTIEDGRGLTAVQAAEERNEPGIVELFSTT